MSFLYKVKDVLKYAKIIVVNSLVYFINKLRSSWERSGFESRSYVLPEKKSGFGLLILAFQVIC